MKIATPALEAIQAHGEEGFPHEICGLLVGYPGQGLITEVRRLRNVEKDQPEVRYKVDDKEDMRIRREFYGTELDVIGYYHSHPNHPAYASKTDAALSWESYVYVILSVQEGKAAEVKAFVAEKDQGPMRPEPLEIV